MKTPSVLCLVSLVIVSAGCGDSPPLLPNVPPEARFVFNPIFPVIAGETVVVFNGTPSRDSDGTVTSYEWNFGDGSPVVSGSEAIVTHVFVDTAETCLEITYAVLLTVADNDRARNSAAANVGVTEPPKPDSLECLCLIDPRLECPACALEIQTTSLDDGQVGRSYSEGVGALLGVCSDDPEFFIQSGELPPGIGLNQSKPNFVGTPTQAGTFAFVLGLRADGLTNTQALSITIREAEGP